MKELSAYTLWYFHLIFVRCIQMLNELVFSKIGFFWAILTSIGPINDVNMLEILLEIKMTALVIQRIRVRWKSLLAVFASKRFLPGMCSLMSLKTPSLPKALSTNLALEVLPLERCSYLMWLFTLVFRVKVLSQI